jgi:hypothetical protein
MQKQTTREAVLEFLKSNPINISATERELNEAYAEGFPKAILASFKNGSQDLSNHRLTQVVKYLIPRGLKLTTEQLNECNDSDLVAQSEAQENALQGYAVLRKYALPRLKGLFSRQELTALVAIQNGTMLTKEYQANVDMFALHIEDGAMFEAMYFDGIDLPALLEKARTMHPAEVFFLQEEIASFWESGGEIETFLDKYAI